MSFYCEWETESSSRHLYWGVKHTDTVQEERFHCLLSYVVICELWLQMIWTQWVFPISFYEFVSATNFTTTVITVFSFLWYSLFCWRKRKSHSTSYRRSSGHLQKMMSSKAHYWQNFVLKTRCKCFWLGRRIICGNWWFRH